MFFGKTFLSNTCANRESKQKRQQWQWRYEEWTLLQRKFVQLKDFSILCLVPTGKFSDLEDIFRSVSPRMKAFANINWCLATHKQVLEESVALFPAFYCHNYLSNGDTIAKQNLAIGRTDPARPFHRSNDSIVFEKGNAADIKYTSPRWFFFWRGGGGGAKRRKHNTNFAWQKIVEQKALFSFLEIVYLLSLDAIQVNVKCKQEYYVVVFSQVICCG